MEYNANSIKHLSFREGAKMRIGVYLGSADNEGVLNGLLEIVNNSTDEANAGYGKDIIITVSNKWASVEDFGRGLPRGKTDRSEEIMITLLTENHSGAKFDKKAYSGFSRGLNGSGGGATAVSSDWFEVISKRDGFEWKLRLEDGLPTTKTAIQGKATQDTGTYIKWQPSQTVFSAETINFDYQRVADLIEEYSYFNVGIKFTVVNADTGEKKEFLSKNGLQDFAEDRIQDSIHKTPIKNTLKDEESGAEIEVIAKWTANRDEKYYLFVNGAECPEGGTPITGAKTGITRTINNLTKKSFSGDLVRKGLVYIIAIKHPHPSFANQIKTKINNSELRGLCDTIFSNALKNFDKDKPTEFKRIVDVLSKVDKAEKAAEKARDKVLSTDKQLNRLRNKKVTSPKLKDAINLGQDAVLMLAEGVSAAGAINSAKGMDEYDKYGTLELRGKVISAMTNPIDKVLDNEEVRLLISALGLNLKNYDSSKLRYGKVVIVSDADADGANIANLIVELFYVLFPEFLKENRLYRLVSPLYKVSKGNKTHYYYSEEEAQAGVSGKRERWKGLGSIPEEDTYNIFFNEKIRKIPLIEWDEEASKLIDTLLGKDVQPRKEFVFNEIDFTEYGGDM